MVRALLAATPAKGVQRYDFARSLVSGVGWGRAFAVRRGGRSQVLPRCCPCKHDSAALLHRSLTRLAVPLPIPLQLRGMAASEGGDSPFDMAADVLKVGHTNPRFLCMQTLA